MLFFSRLMAHVRAAKPLKTSPLFPQWDHWVVQVKIMHHPPTIPASQALPRSLSDRGMFRCLNIASEPNLQYAIWQEAGILKLEAIITTIILLKAGPLGMYMNSFLIIIKKNSWNQNMYYYLFFENQFDDFFNNYMYPD